MKESNVIELRGPAGPRDALTEMLRSGARLLIKEAVEAELNEFLELYQGHRLADGKAQVVRNGYLPEREVQTGIGAVQVSVPRTRDRGISGLKFTSKLLPPYLRRSSSVEELLPWLYLKGISTNHFAEALEALLGPNALGLSPSTISRLKSDWEGECKEWNTRPLHQSSYVYIWVDGIHCGIRQEDNKMCVLVVMGVTPSGVKEIIAIDDGYRESEESWLGLLRDLKERGMTAPYLGIGDGALGFWKALRQVYPATREQRCWQHKTINVLDKLPKNMREKTLTFIQNIWMAETRAKAEKAWNIFVAAYRDKYPKAVETLEKDKESLLTFFDFPAAHWRSIRTTNPIESTFATVRQRSSRTKGCVSRKSMLALIFKLVQSAEKRWNRLAAFGKLEEIIHGIKFVDGIAQNQNDFDLKKDQQLVA